MSKTAKMWVVQLHTGGYAKQFGERPYYVKAPYCGGTDDVQDARLFEHKPTPHVGKAVEVVVTRTVEVVT